MVKQVSTALLYSAFPYYSVGCSLGCCSSNWQYRQYRTLLNIELGRQASTSELPACLLDLHLFVVVVVVHSSG